MAIKKFNEATQRWEKVTSLLANSSAVLDVNGDFTGDNVEDCLHELKDEIKKLSKDVKYIYNNGSIGSGPGTGGGSRPDITVSGSTTYTVTTDQILTIRFNFTSPNRGNGVVTLVNGDNIETRTVDQTRLHSWTVGPFPKGEHVLTISAVDSLGFSSVPVSIIVMSGALELTSNFDDQENFSLAQPIKIPFEINGLGIQDIVVSRKLNGIEDDDKSGRIGVNYFDIGLLPSFGTHIVSIKATAEDGKYESNELKFRLIAADGDTLYIVSEDFDSEFSWELNKPLSIKYRISKANESYFYSDFYIDGEIVDRGVQSFNGANNFWNVGSNLELGEHNLRLVVRTIDGLQEKELNFRVIITNEGYTPISIIEDGLMAEFLADGRQNTSGEREIWKPRKGSKKDELRFSLENFNFTNKGNGWIDNNLRFNGKACATLNYKPFENGIPLTGFTFEIVYKARNTGNADAKVVSCSNYDTPYQGFYIDTYKAYYRPILGGSVQSEYEEEEFTRKTFVFDPSNKLIKIFTDAVISAVERMSYRDNTDLVRNFQYDGEVILGAESNNSILFPEYLNHADCEIKSVRLYDRALTDLEVLKNHIADIKDLSEQEYYAKLNSITSDLVTEKGIPQILVTGGIDPSVIVPNVDYDVKMRYINKDEDKDITIDKTKFSLQGTSSTKYPVKNFTAQLYDSNGLPMYNFSPKDEWNPEPRWTLKANYMDSSQANSGGAYKFIHDYFLNFNRYPNQAEDSMQRSCPDAFPVEMIIGGKSQGLYTWNIDRYAFNNYGLNKYVLRDGVYTIEKNAVAVSYELAYNNGLANSFLSDNWEEIRKDFKHRYNYRETNTNSVVETIATTEGSAVVLKAGQHEELQRLVTWLVNCTEEEFVAELKDRISIPHLIDYYLIAEVLGMIDNMGKNMVLTYYGPEDDGFGNTINTKWYPSFYDCDSIIGLSNVGIIDKKPSVEFDTENPSNSGYEHVESKLWKLFKKNFFEQIRQRYIEMRHPLKNALGQVIRPAIFSYEHIITFFRDEIISKIGQRYYNEDAAKKYIDNADASSFLYLCRGSRINFTKRWLKERLIFLDSVYEDENFTTSLAIIRTNKQGELVLNLKTHSPQKIKIQYTSSEADSVKMTVSKDNFTTFRYEINNGKNNDLTIYGVSNLTQIDGLETLNVSFLDLSRAEKLSEIILTDNKLLTGLSVQENKYLRKLDCSGCTALGTDIQSSGLDLSNSHSLLYLDLNKTALQSIKFPEGGVIDHLNLSETKITGLNLEGQAYLKRLNLASCKDIASVYVQDCQRLEEISMPSSQVQNLTVKLCERLNKVDLSGSSRLNSIVTEMCPALTTLNISGTRSNNITTLDLTTLESLENLNISGSYVKYIKFGIFNGANYNKLKSFNASSSSIMSVGFGSGATFNANSRLNLDQFPNLTSLNLQTCNSLKYVDLGTRAVSNNSSISFHKCNNLLEVTGKITVRNSFANVFYDCFKLYKFPELDLTECTSLYATFYSCVAKKNGDTNSTEYAVDTNFIKNKVLSKVTSKLTDLSYAFYNCPGIKTGDGVPDLPKDLFSKATGVTKTVYAFGVCSNLSGYLHQDLLKPMTKLTNAERMFTGCKILGMKNDLNSNLPFDTNFFAFNTNLQITWRMFENNKITKVPANNLLMSLRNSLTNAYGMFNGCSEMTGPVPADIFVGCKNLKSIGPFFAGTKITGNIPANIFDVARGNSSITNLIEDVERCFSNCTLIEGTIPSTLLSKCKNLKIAKGLFSGTNISGQIPENLFAENKSLSSVSCIFQNCTRLGDTSYGTTCTIPPKLFANNASLANVSYTFDGCRNLSGNIPVGLFDNCSSLSNVEGLFKNCSYLTGQIPMQLTRMETQPHPTVPGETIEVEVITQNGLFDNTGTLSNVKEVFYNCQRLNSSIPPTLFKNATTATDFSGIFQNCFYLHGGVPVKLFETCTEMQKLDNAFRLCVTLNDPNKLGNDAKGENEYCLPEDLFMNNKKLTSLSCTFYMWHDRVAPYRSKLSGSIPPKLFRNLEKVRSMDGLFHSTEISGHLDNATFKNCKELTTLSDAFQDARLTSLGDKLFLPEDNPALRSLFETFRDNRTLTGNPFDYSKVTQVTNTKGCFAGTNLSNLATIPDVWK